MTDPVAPVSLQNALRFACWITAINVLVSAGFSIAGLVAPHSVLPAGASPNEASEIFALYTAARALPLAAVTIWAIARRSVTGLIVLGALATIIQLFDGAIGIVQHDFGKVIGPWVIAALQAYATSRLERAKRAGG